MRRTGSPTGPACGRIPADPIEGGGELIAWWKAQGRDPREKLLVFSDAMDVDSIETSFPQVQRATCASRYGWGTNLTNDFKGCDPRGGETLKAISLVCKVVEADGRPAVKLSDNPVKATGSPTEVERSLRVFGNAGRVRTAVHV